MNESNIQHGIWLMGRGGHSLMCPNFTPIGWWECDVAGVSKTNMLTEWEIKRSVADFKKDAEKEFDGLRKHDEIAAGNGPNRFYWVMEPSLIEQVEIPEWGGIVAASQARGFVWCRVVRRAPRLHKRKVDERIIKQMAGVFYYRFWNLKGRTV